MNNPKTQLSCIDYWIYEYKDTKTLLTVPENTEFLLLGLPQHKHDINSSLLWCDVPHMLIVMCESRVFLYKQKFYGHIFKPPCTTVGLWLNKLHNKGQIQDLGFYITGQ